MDHSYVTEDGVHIPWRWRVADSAALGALAPDDALDVGKVALVEDSASIHILIDLTPTWTRVGTTVPEVQNHTATMGASTKDPATDAVDDWLEVQVDGTTYYIPLYAAS